MARKIGAKPVKRRPKPLPLAAYHEEVARLTREHHWIISTTLYRGATLVEAWLNGTHYKGA